MKDRYDLLINDIKKFEQQFESDQTLVKIKEKYYRGIQVLLSPLRFEPAFLLIGINPGAGYFKEYKKNVKRFEPLAHFEYLHYNYLLARETRKVFDKAGLNNELKNAVKSNCYFFATVNANHLHELLSHLKADYNIYQKSRFWFKELIDIIQPQIIICEGKGAFEELAGKIIPDDQSIKGCYSSIYNNIPVIGYERRMSFMVEKDNFASLLKKTHSALNIRQ